jgi:Zn-dependent M16 (insulinase) family peptidase
MQATTALDVLGEYLSDSAVSILSQTFIEIEDPITTSIQFLTSYQLPCTLSIYFESVPVEHLDTLEEKLFEVFGNIVKGGIDMERMATVVQVEKNRSLLAVEESPSNPLSSKLINEALYGSLDGKTLKEDVNDLMYYDVVSNWTSDEWVALLKRSQPLV